MDAQTWRQRLDNDYRRGLSTTTKNSTSLAQDGRLMVLSASTGKTLFECDLGGGGVGTPIVDGKGVFAVTRSAAWLLHLPGD